MNEASHPSPGPTRILLVECNATLRVGLQAWLHQEFPHQKIDTASSRELAEELAARHAPALVLVDIDALRGEGFATLRSMGALLPEALLVALSLYPVNYFHEPATKAGAVGCACIALTDNRLRDLLRGLLHLPRSNSGASKQVDAPRRPPHPKSGFLAMNANALRVNDNMTNMTGSAEMLRRVIASSPDCVKILDLDGRLIWMSEPGRRAMQLEASQDVVGVAWLESWNGEDRVRAEAAVASAVAGGTGRFSGFCPTAKGTPRWWDVIVTAMFDGNGQPEQLLSVSRDISEQVRVEHMVAGECDIKAGIAAQRPLAETLSRIALLHEALNPGSLCSLLLLDADGKTLLHGAAPSLPEAYNQAVNGLEIGDRRGSCGTAAWRRERAVVADIASHPYWENYRGFTLMHGLRACWSTPVLGVGGQVLGTFAVYYRDAREPSPGELEYVDKLLAVAAIAIESTRLLDRLRVRDRFFDMSREIFCVFDPLTAQFVQVNPAFTGITGYSQAEMTARHARHFVHPDDRKITADAVSQLRSESTELREFSNRFLCRNGGHRWLQWTAGVAPDGLVYAVGRDITEQRQVDSQLVHAINHDAITGLPHHLLFEGILASRLEDASAPVWIFFVGLDRFQSINESMGHVIGDEALRQVAERLCAAVGQAGEIARFAGDEFIIGVTALDQSSAMILAAQLRAAIAPVIEIGDYRLLLTASIGISHSPDHGLTGQDLLRRAEAAMMRAKRQGRDCACEFSVEQMLEIEDRLVLGSHLRGAIQRGELALHYQPQHHAASGALTGFEALLRWSSKALGPVPPGRFIPVAEALGLMPEIGAWVLNEACRQAGLWMDQGYRGFNIAVNVAAPQLQRPGLVAEVRDALVRHAVPAEVLSIELTESALMENVVRVRGTLVELKSMGVKLALDDFGTGYSSLAYLKQFPFDKIKIDQSFVRGLPDDGDDATIARTIVAMAHQLRMLVVAEGVETESQSVFLTAIGCDELQGYLLGRPVPAATAEAFFAVGTPVG